MIISENQNTSLTPSKVEPFHKSSNLLCVEFPLSHLFHKNWKKTALSVTASFIFLRTPFPFFFILNCWVRPRRVLMLPSWGVSSQKPRYSLYLVDCPALLNLSLFGFSFGVVVFHDKAKRTDQGTLLPLHPFPSQFFLSRGYFLPGFAVHFPLISSKIVDLCRK